MKSDSDALGTLAWKDMKKVKMDLESKPKNWLYYFCPLDYSRCLTLYLIVDVIKLVVQTLLIE